MKGFALAVALSAVVSYFAFLTVAKPEIDRTAQLWSDITDAIIPALERQP